MKTLSTIAAGMLVAFLALTPLVSVVAAATVTVSVNPTSAQGVVAMSVTGTVSPAPTGQVAAVKVLNPSGTIVAQGQPTVDSTTGGFTYSFSTGGTANWKSGTYTVTAVVGSDTATPATFVYACAEAICGASGGVQAGATTAINVQVTAETPVWPGQEITISVLTFSAANGSLVEATFQTVHYHPPIGSLVTLCTNIVTTNCSGTFTRIHIGFYEWTLTLPANAPDGGYFIHAWVNNGATQQGQGVGQFTVNSGLAQQSTVSAASTAITAMQGTLTSIQGSITTTFGQLSTTLTTLQTAATATQDAANKAAAAATALSGSVTAITTGVQSSQTYILVVAALAAITLVLELAILVRKLS